jgi:hypothetical protein
VPHYAPLEVKRLAADPKARRLTRAAFDGCAALGLDPDVVWDTLLETDSQSCRFIKTLKSDQRPGELLDVYDALVDTHQVYLKLKIVQTRDQPPKILVVLSFKRNEYYERSMR